MQNNPDAVYWQKAHEKYATKDWIVKPTIFATQVINYFPKSSYILELGCGQGQDSIYFAQRGHKVLACDLSDFALGKAPRNSNIEYRHLDLLEKLPFQNNTFDVVYSHLALHYFDDTRTQELFDEIYSVLKMGGVFCALTNTIDDPEVNTLTKIADEYYITQEGLKKRFFSVKSMGKYTTNFEKILLDNHGETHKDEIKTLIRFVGRKHG